MNTPTIKIGLYGIGLDTYWDQFKGLHNRLVGYQETIAARMGEYGVEVVNAGLVDNPEAARASGEMFRSAGVEAIFLYISTYALSHTVLPVVQKVNVPVVVLNLQPVPARSEERRGGKEC